MPLFSLIGDLREARLSLLVEELANQAQGERHLVLQPTADEDGNVPVLSGFAFSVDSSSQHAQLKFRADLNDLKDQTLKIQVAERRAADATALVQGRLVAIRDAATTAAASGSLKVDFDGRTNQQVSTRFSVDLTAQDNKPFLSLEGPSLDWSSPATVTPNNTLTFQETVHLSAWRVDHGKEAVSFGLTSGSTAISLLNNAAGGSAKAITPLSVFNDDPLTGWKATEGVTVGSRQSNSAQTLPDLVGGNWIPTARRNGQSLPLKAVNIEGNRITASFAEDVTLQVFFETVTSAPANTPIPPHPQVTIQRLGVLNTAIGIYAVDNITGSVGDLSPGDPGYLDAALARSKASQLFLDQSMIPTYGAEKTYRDLPLDPAKDYGVLLLVYGRANQIYSSYSAANPGGRAQAINLGSPGNGVVIGFEDQPIQSNTNNKVDADFNDMIVQISHQTYALF